MAKKRVYELAKDLGLSNKEMVDWLKAHEYDVKSHSSSLEDDQAQAVTEKVLVERAPKAVAAKPSASGVVLRRKKADTLGPDGQPVGDHHDQQLPPVASIGPAAAEKPAAPAAPVTNGAAPHVSAAPEPKPSPVEPEKPAAAVAAAPA